MVKKFYLVSLASFLLALFFVMPARAQGEIRLTKDLLTDSYSKRDVSFDKWSNGAFEDTDGNIIDKGIGFFPYYSDTHRMFAVFNVSDYQFTTFETTVSLENAWRTGELGSTGMIVYADNKEIFNKTFNNGTPSEKLKLSVPTGTTFITLAVTQQKGAQGRHGAIFGNPVLTNNLPSSPSFSSVSLAGIGTASYSNRDTKYGSWNDNPFKLPGEEFVGHGYGFSRYYSDTYEMYAEFNIADYNYTTLETKVSIDDNYRVGDRGKTQFLIYADGKKIYSKWFTNLTPAENVQVAIPKGTTYLKLQVVQDPGLQGSHRAIFVNPIMTNKLPSKESEDFIRLRSIGMAEYSGSRDIYYRNWSNSSFQMTDGSLISEAYGFYPYYSSTTNMFAKFYTGDYNFNTLQTKISLDNKWRTGDRGKTVVKIYADDKPIYSYTFTNKTLAQNVLAKVPKGTQYVTLKVVETQGSAGGHGVIFENPMLIDKKVSTSLKASQIKVMNNKGASDKVVVSGLNKNEIIKVYAANGNLLASAKGSQNVILTIKQLGKNKGVVYVTRTSADMLESSKVSVNFSAEK
ncbi:NPCBM/NEW2 domain-containing protein [Saccharibacillus kuerlensis]|uniref:Glycosyl hydrolase family 98 putative carbohydrate-binding module domain-containing protein n=1 Tax=Saccharibacillus kuerlensis TaxID=459527 RepID=A0ABQ2L527_9BACL|nr:NPCBM/NEW2 domain-containing protein [Saccharibacillus kuerlensis]GGO03347.1 hypothetical protein GCM10010969_27510 [Saccharibacillus kuerlensis]